MRTPNLRFYSFVAKFVDAVATDALSSELVRLGRARRREGPTSAPVTLPIPAADAPLPVSEAA